jgi:exopolyphosphatase/guanosine-5'-triphosphate,3'-diphosphate pyrophosphatase
MNSDLLEETLVLRNRYDDEPLHSDHVAMLAVQLFDALEPWHRLGPRERELQQCSALLHDIGWSQTVEGRRHHKKSAKLILKEKWRHLSPEEVTIVAQLARYHRKSPPQPKHKEFHALTPSAQRKVMILGGILRQADALDRTHIQKIAGVSARVTDDALIVEVKSPKPWPEEKAIFEKKRDMLESASTRAVKCENAK